MSQERISSDSKVISSTTNSSNLNIDRTLDKAAIAKSKIRVSQGANDRYFKNLEGKTVGQVRKSLRQAFNISSEASALIGGKEVEDDYILETGDHLEFFKASGVKGWFLSDLNFH